MSERYMYKGRNLTSFIWIKAEKTAELLAERQGIPFEEALQLFMESKTYALLQDTETLYWGENAAFILDDYLLQRQGSGAQNA